MEKKKGIIIGAIVVVAILVIAGIAIAIANSGSGVKKYEEGDKITVAVNPDFAPYDTMVGTEFAGIDMDIVRGVFYVMGLEEGKNFEFVAVDFDGIVMGVQQGKYTMGASGFTQTADRMSKVLFSEEYAASKQVAVVKQNNTSITKVDDIKGKAIVVETGTTGDTLATDNFSNDSGDNISRVNKYADARQQIISGASEVLIVDVETAMGMVAENNGDSSVKILDSITLPGNKEYYAFIFNMVNTDLCMDVTTIMRDHKASINAIEAYYAANDYKSDTQSYWKTHDLKDF